MQVRFLPLQPKLPLQDNVATVVYVTAWDASSRKDESKESYVRELLAIIMLLIPCGGRIDAAEDPKTYQEIMSEEVKNMRLAGQLEGLGDWAISCAPRFAKEKGGRPRVNARHHAVVIVSKASMDALYLRLNGRRAPENMVAFRWAKNEIIIMSKGDRGELYHEIGHYLFGDDERPAEEFKKWCMDHDPT